MTLVEFFKIVHLPKDDGALSMLSFFFFLISKFNSYYTVCVLFQTKLQSPGLKTKQMVTAVSYLATLMRLDPKVNQS